MPQNALRSALPLSERSGERRGLSHQPRATPWVMCVEVIFRAVSAKAFGFAFVRHDSAKRASTMVLAAPSFAPVGRGFSCTTIPRAMPWAVSSLALQAALKEHVSIRYGARLYPIQSTSFVHYGARLYSLRSIAPFFSLSLRRGLGRGPIFTIILAPRWQLVVLQIWQHLLQLQEEALAWFVAVGIHVE